MKQKRDGMYFNKNKIYENMVKEIKMKATVG
jgi:hypothetical protein